MPTYPYKCRTCGHEWEQVQGINEPDAQCPNEYTDSRPLVVVGEDLGPRPLHKVERLIGTTNFSLKGEGWYKDGYGSKPK